MFKRVSKSNLVHVGTHGAKMGSKDTVKVADQEDDLFFYKENRNEPVPPDPRIISAVKHTPAVIPTSKVHLPKEIEPGKRTSSKLDQVSNLQADRVDTGIPTFSLFPSFQRVSPQCSTGDELTGLREWKSVSDRKCESSEASAGNPVSDTNTCGEDKSRVGPAIFVVPERGESPLKLVKISSGSGPLDCIVTNVDERMEDELDKLQQFMYSEFVNGRIAPAGDIKVRDYVGLVMRRELACLRVQVLHLFKWSDDVQVYLIDYGWERRVSKRDLIPLKKEWKAVKQLACHAELEGYVGDFLEDLMYSTICVETLEMYKKKRQSPGIPGEICVKCCKLRIYNEHRAILALENLDDGF